MQFSEDAFRVLGPMKLPYNEQFRGHEEPNPQLLLLTIADVVQKLDTFQRVSCETEASAAVEAFGFLASMTQRSLAYSYILGMVIINSCINLITADI